MQSKMKIGVGLLIATLTATAIGGCSPSKTPAQQQADARAAVLATEAAWMAVAQGCVDVATVTSNEGLLKTCDNLMTPVKDAVLAADSSIDTWASANQGDIACVLHNAIAAINAAAAAAQQSGAPLPPVVKDAEIIINSLNVQCVSDGGAG